MTASYQRTGRRFQAWWAEDWRDADAALPIQRGRELDDLFAGLKGDVCDFDRTSTFKNRRAYAAMF